MLPWGWKEKGSTKLTLEHDDIGSLERLCRPPGEGIHGYCRQERHRYENSKMQLHGTVVWCWWRISNTSVFFCFVCVSRRERKKEERWKEARVVIADDADIIIATYSQLDSYQEKVRRRSRISFCAHNFELTVPTLYCSILWDVSGFVRLFLILMKNRFLMENIR